MHGLQAMRDIVAKCLVKDPSKRPTAAQLLEHKFFKVLPQPLPSCLQASTPSCAEIPASQSTPYVPAHDGDGF